MIIADLHIHSRYSRATSQRMDIEHLTYFAKKKGISLLGTGDFTHPSWLKEVKEKISDEMEDDGIHFIPTTEINLIFESEGKERKVHLLLIARDFEVVMQINDILQRYGRLKEDGRPTLFLSPPKLVDDLLEISTSLKDVIIVPAHAWTPWFGIFGSKSGVNSLEEAFAEKARYIYAIETGLSSDIEMNRLVSMLDEISLLSFSDAHSPENLGREATIFPSYTFDAIFHAIRKKEIATIEFFPEEGKYHYDGHRNCNVSLHPEEARKLKNICPKCKKPLTLGVLHRVMDLADRKEPKLQEKFFKFVPLRKVIAKVYGKSENTIFVRKKYDELTESGKELEILMNPDIIKDIDKKVYIALRKIHSRKIRWKPGYDGVYGDFEFIENETISSFL